MANESKKELNKEINNSKDIPKIAKLDKEVAKNQKKIIKNLKYLLNEDFSRVVRNTRIEYWMDLTPIFICLAFYWMKIDGLALKEVLEEMMCLVFVPNMKILIYKKDIILNMKIVCVLAVIVAINSFIIIKLDDMINTDILVVSSIFMLITSIFFNITVDYSTEIRKKYKTRK